MTLNSKFNEVGCARTLVCTHTQHTNSPQKTQHIIPGPNSHINYWTWVKKLHQLGRKQKHVYVSSAPALLQLLSTQYKNYALYCACRANTRAGRRGRHFSIKLKVFRDGGYSRAPHLLQLSSKQLLLASWQLRLLFLVITPAQACANNYINDYLTVSTTLNPLHPTRLPPTRLRLDQCELNFIARRCLLFIYFARDVIIVMLHIKQLAPIKRTGVWHANYLQINAFIPTPYAHNAKLRAHTTFRSHIA